MSSYVEVGRTGEFSDGMKKKVIAGRQEIVLAMVENRYYAIGNRCPHQGGELAAGKLDGTVITCPLHGSRFDITDGRNIRWLKGKGLVASLAKVIKPPRPVPTYDVKVDGDRILIQV